MLFARLSDPDQAEKEAAQTQIYRLIALMDHPHIIPDVLSRELSKHLLKITGEKTLFAVTHALASCAKPVRRFTHHLFLRTLVNYPETFSAERHAYLQQATNWKHQEDYPWPHIEAYRAWLWVLENEPKQALKHMNAAIALAEHHAYGPIMHWIAEVLRTLAQVLGLQTHTLPTQTERMRLQQTLKMAPHTALAEFNCLEQHSAHAHVRAAMKHCLPFNFC
ncbi:hypothetical protein [Thiorhodospira sibirica]|uniref:hypothetical protein n=1 Tax=Thiorhodospira sibirica TaxID=154347 RepID=UPI00022C5E0D|nr:hypothetical protein [Thiorhodospira sibirica]